MNQWLWTRGWVKRRRRRRWKAYRYKRGCWSRMRYKPSGHIFPGHSRLLPFREVNLFTRFLWDRSNVINSPIFFLSVCLVFTISFSLDICAVVALFFQFYSAKWILSAVLAVKDRRKMKKNESAAAAAAVKNKQNVMWITTWCLRSHMHTQTHTYICSCVHLFMPLQSVDHQHNNAPKWHFCDCISTTWKPISLSHQTDCMWFRWFYTCCFIVLLSFVSHRHTHSYRIYCCYRIRSLTHFFRRRFFGYSVSSSLWKFCIEKLPVNNAKSVYAFYGKCRFI